MALEREIMAYNAMLAELIPQSGKYALIAGDDLLGVFDTYADALTEGYKERRQGQFLVKQISPAEQISYVTREYVIPCPSSH